MNRGKEQFRALEEGVDIVVRASGLDKRDCLCRRHQWHLDRLTLFKQRTPNPEPLNTNPKPETLSPKPQTPKLWELWVQIPYIKMGKPLNPNPPKPTLFRLEPYRS